MIRQLSSHRLSHACLTVMGFSLLLLILGCVESETTTVGVSSDLEEQVGVLGIIGPAPGSAFIRESVRNIHDQKVLMRYYALPQSVDEGSRTVTSYYRQELRTRGWSELQPVHASFSRFGSSKAPKWQLILTRIGAGPPDSTHDELILFESQIPWNAGFFYVLQVEPRTDR
jgi:hypothetical protein